MKLNCLRAEGDLGGRELLISTHRICPKIHIHTHTGTSHTQRLTRTHMDTAGTWNLHHLDSCSNTGAYKSEYLDTLPKHTHRLTLRHVRGHMCRNTLCTQILSYTCVSHTPTHMHRNIFRESHQTPPWDGHTHAHVCTHTFKPTDSVCLPKRGRFINKLRPLPSQGVVSARRDGGGISLSSTSTYQLLVQPKSSQWGSLKVARLCN